MMEGMGACGVLCLTSLQTQFFPNSGRWAENSRPA